MSCGCFEDKHSHIWQKALYKVNSIYKLHILLRIDHTTTVSESHGQPAAWS